MPWTAEVIATGTELLQGRTLNQHGYRLGTVLLEHGIPLTRETVLPDDRAQIADALRQALARSSLVFVTGGIGPTDDDVTREAVAEALGRAVVHAPAADAHLEACFARMGKVPTDAQRRQALVVDGAVACLNPVGIAPGQCIELPEPRRVVWVLPGPPRELNGLLRDAVIPWLRATCTAPSHHMRLFRILGRSESDVQSTLRSAGFLPDSLDVSYCARPGSVELRLTSAQGAAELDQAVRETRALFADDILSEDGAPVECVVGRLLCERERTVAVAESCTAGGIQACLTDVPGSSGYFLGGVVAYANSAKELLLGVEPGLLEIEGAVSEAVVVQMARGVRARLGADFGLAISGVAGPGGGTEEKPVGLFYVALAHAEGTQVRRFQVSGNRAQIRDHGVQRALECLWRFLK